MKKIVFLILGLLLFLSMPIYAEPIEINSIDLLNDNSSFSNSTYTLNSGDFSVTAPLNVGLNANLFIESETTLSLLSADNETLLKLKNLTINTPSSTLKAKGGSSANTLALSANSITVLGGNIESIGGLGEKAYGIYSDSITLTTGIIKSSGGAAKYSHGIYTNEFTLNTGYLDVKGSSINEAYGLYVEGSFTQKDGTIDSLGGDHENSYGIYVANDFIQQKGVLFSKGGGSNENAIGLYVAKSFVQNNGEIATKGGLFTKAHGIYSLDFTQNDGLLTATGGSFSDVYGLNTNTFTQNNGKVVSIAGSYRGAYGIHISGDFTQNGGTIEAKSGDARSTTDYLRRIHGIYVTGTLTQNGNITTNGAKSESSYGIYANNFIMEKGTLSAKGGSSNMSVGLYALRFTQNDGIIDTYGGGWGTADGLYIKDFVQNGGYINAYGGYYNDASGFYSDTFIQNNGQINAYGGSIDVTAGFYSRYFTQNDGKIYALAGEYEDSVGFGSYSFNQKGGYIYTDGGSKNQAYGMIIQEFTQDKGYLQATGGSYGTANGLFVSDKLVQNNGIINATGGSYIDSIGIQVKGTLTQNGGTIISIGGSSTTTPGVYAHNFVQDGGSLSAIGSVNDYTTGFGAENFHQKSGDITATGGIGAEAYGIHILSKAVFSDVLWIERQGEAASIYAELNNEHALVLSETSVLIPVIDFRKEDNLASGLIKSDRRIDIKDGAKIQPFFKNTSSLKENEAVNVLFMDSSLRIEGEYYSEDLLSAIGTATMNYEVHYLTADRLQYYITVTRIKTPFAALLAAVDLGDDSISQNDIMLTKTIYDFLTDDDNSSHKLNLVLDAMDNSEDTKTMLTVLSGVNPTNKLDYLIWQDITANNMMSSKNNLLQLLNTPKTSLANISINPTAEFGVYNDTKISSYGGSIAASYKLKEFSIGLLVSVMPTYTKKEHVDTNGIYTSAMIAAGYSFKIGSFNPQIAIDLGYAHNKISIAREDVFSDNYNVDVKQNFVTLGLTIGNEFKIIENLSLIAELGLDYSYINFTGYYEDNTEGMPISADGYNVYSLKPFVQTIISYEIKKFVIKGDLQFGVETLNTDFDGTLYWYNADEIFYESSEVETNDARLSFNIGVSGIYNISDKFNLALGYSFYMHGKYMSHKIDLNFCVNF